MNRNNLHDGLEELILERINAHHLNEPEAVSAAYSQFAGRSEKLRNTLSGEQKLIYNTCEDAYLLLDGETINFYYRAGFSDAIRFLFGWTDSTQWRDGKWN